MKTRDKVYTALGVLFPVILLVLIIFDNQLIMVFGSAKPFITALPFIGACWVFISTLWRVLSTMSNPEKFYAKMLIPAATVLICMVLAVVFVKPIVLVTREMELNSKRDDFLAFVQEHKDIQISGDMMEIELQGKDKRLSATGKVLAIDVEGQRCYIFYTLNADNILEGYLYLPTQRLYYGVYRHYIDFEDYVYDDNFAWVRFYKK